MERYEELRVIVSYVRVEEIEYVVKYIFNTRLLLSIRGDFTKRPRSVRTLP